MKDTQKVEKILDRATYIVALLMSVYHLLASQYTIFPSELHINIHLMFALVIVFLQAIKFGEKYSKLKNLIYIVMIVGTIVTMTYIHFHAMEFQFAMGKQPFDKVLTGAVLIIIMLFATRTVWGRIIPIIAIIGLLYGYFGPYMPSVFYHGGLSLPRLITYVSTNFTGIYGMLASVSANTIVQFAIFAGILESFGAIKLIMDVAMSASNKIRSGGAQVAVISSGIVGSISGSVAANIAMTGAVSIPLMKKRGYPSEFAAACEAAASTGGAILPPVMNAAAFIISAWISVPYIMVAAIGLAPALLYYMGISLSVYIKALKLGDEKIKDEILPDFRKAFLNLLLYLSSIVLLVVLMAMGYSPQKSLFYSTFLLIAIGLVTQFRKNGEEGSPLKRFFKKLADGLAGGGKSVAGIAIVCACMGILVEVLTATGLPSKISQFSLMVAGENLFLLAVMVAITCLVFGMGMPSGPAYILAALLGAPALTALGVPLIVAHFFVFYFAEMSAVTPPVAIGCLVASGMAQAKFFRTCVESIRLAIAGFVLPFLFIYRPALLLQGTAWETIWSVLVVGAFLLCFIVTWEAFFMQPIRLPSRICFAIAAVCFLIPIYVLDFVGLALLAALLIYEVSRYRKTKALRQTA